MEEYEPTRLSDEARKELTELMTGQARQYGMDKLPRAESMRKIVDISIEAVILRGVALSQGLGSWIGPGTLGEDGFAHGGSQRGVLSILPRPKGLFETITLEEFAPIYAGAGLNEPKTPLEGIYPGAEQMALFAVTSGNRLAGDRRALRQQRFCAGLRSGCSCLHGAELAAEAVGRTGSTTSFMGDDRSI